MPLDTIAYIDAGTGSYLLAALAGGAATFWFFLKSSMARIFGRGKPATTDVDGQSETQFEDEVATDR